ncbi:MAG: glycoside hydrolase family 127 protein, partial [Lentisphaerae bacterium]|nr:glycoside hydrolase family 127 protein [Lentisphaerota bacterium]
MPTKNAVVRKIKPVQHSSVSFNDKFWSKRIETNRTKTIPAVYDNCKNSGRINAWRIDWKPGKKNTPHHFWDSDVAKWMEAAAYSLATHPDKVLERQLKSLTKLISSAQMQDGYLNSYYQSVDIANRWTNLRDMHELYCAGHLIEAAVAFKETTGDNQFLDTLIRYVKHIDSQFGNEPGKKPGYPGHQEIELALIKLYRLRKDKKHLDLATYFIDERGKDPKYFDVEAKLRGATKPLAPETFKQLQAHLPVREMRTAEGHAVRACYLYSAMVDVATETGDKTLLTVSEQIWKNITERRMYITGGVGSDPMGERFSYDYDLPNETAYAETCANISLVFFAHRLLQVNPKSEYADVMERALYNSVISGVSLDGTKFFYENPLAARNSS